MKIAITSTGTELASDIDSRFGRAAYFIIYDTESNDFQAIENSSAAAAGGAGINAAKTVIDAEAQAVLTSNCGPNAQRTLSAANIKIYTGIEGTVEQAIEMFSQGRLTETTEPDVDAHFGSGI